MGKLISGAASWLAWAIWQLTSSALGLIGYLIIAVCAFGKLWYQRQGRNPAYPGRTLWEWKGGWLTYPFCNEEDGVIPPAEVNGSPYWAGWPQGWRAFWWSAWRNSVNNLRMFPGNFVVFESDPVVTITKNGYTASYGWRRCLQWRRLRIGWLINPTAKKGDYSWLVTEIV